MSESPETLEKNGRRAWFYIVEGERYGPITQSRLLEALSNGELALETQVWSPGMATWVPVLRVLELKEALAPAVEVALPLVRSTLPEGEAERAPSRGWARGRQRGLLLAALLALPLLLWGGWSMMGSVLPRYLEPSEAAPAAISPPPSEESRSEEGREERRLLQATGDSLKGRWYLLSEEEGLRKYLDRERLEIQSDTVLQAWYSTEFAAGEEQRVVLEGQDTVWASRLVESVQADCRNLRFAYLADYYYDREGELLRSHSYPEVDSPLYPNQWRDAVPDSQGESWVRSACRVAGLPRVGAAREEGDTAEAREESAAGTEGGEAEESPLPPLR